MTRIQTSNFQNNTFLASRVQVSQEGARRISRSETISAPALIRSVSHAASSLPASRGPLRLPSSATEPLAYVPYGSCRTGMDPGGIMLFALFP